MNSITPLKKFTASYVIGVKGINAKHTCIQPVFVFGFYVLEIET